MGADDIAHRDRCQANLNKNKNDEDDLNHDISKAEDSITEMKDKSSKLNSEISQLETDIEETKTQMKEALEMRNSAHKDFKQALEDDMNGVDLLAAALQALGKFYKKNKIPMGFVQEEH